MSKLNSPEASETEPRPPATPADVAREAGVSLVTVSRALNDSARVSPETRARVLEAARRLGYRPNFTARALRKGQTNTIAIVLKSGHLFSGFHSEMLAGFYSMVHERQLRIMLSVVPPEEENSRLWLQELMSAAGFDSLVLHQELFRGFAPELSRLSMPLLLAGLLPHPTPAEESLVRVGFDHAGGILQAIRHLAALGHTRIAYLHDSGPALGPSVRPEAYRAGLAELGLPFHDSWLATVEFAQGAEAGRRSIQRLYSGPPPYPTAVLCASDLIAAGVIDGAEAWGRRVPEDLSVIGYGNAPWTTSFRPALTTVHQSGYELGRVLGRRILDLRDATPNIPRITALPMELIVRNSTAPPRAEDS